MNTCWECDTPDRCLSAEVCYAMNGEGEMTAESGSTKYLKALVPKLRKQLAERDAEIAQLQADKLSCIKDLALRGRSLTAYEAEIDRLKEYIREIRPFADCYKRVCKSLGIERDILGAFKAVEWREQKLKEAARDAMQYVVIAEQVGMDDAQEFHKAEAALDLLETLIAEEPNAKS